MCGTQFKEAFAHALDAARISYSLGVLDRIFASPPPSVPSTTAAAAASPRPDRPGATSKPRAGSPPPAPSSAGSELDEAGLGAGGGGTAPPQQQGDDGRERARTQAREGRDASAREARAHRFGDTDEGVVVDDHGVPYHKASTAAGAGAGFGGRPVSRGRQQQSAPPW